MKRVFIVHCWQGTPDAFWYPWLAAELEKKGFEAHVLEMPETDAPKIEAWASTLSQAVGATDSETYFVGHSIGCQTIFRYLQTLPEDTKIGGVVCVAGWFHLPSLEADEEKEIAAPWLNTPLDTEKLKKILDGKLAAIFSSDDPYVPLTDADLFKDDLGAKVIVESDMGHFDTEEMTELPVALEQLLKIAK